MAALIPSASATGSGTMTLAGPSTNSNQTITIPDATGTMMVSGNMPAFASYLSSNQTISAGTLVTVQFSATQFDTASCFNTGTYRFTPTVAGYYLFTAFFGYTANPNNDQWIMIYKNGSYYGTVNESNPTASASFGGFPCSPILISMNGTTDYVDMRIKNYSTSSQTLQGGVLGGTADEKCFFQGFLVRTT
jgi:hypothetical protein